MDVWRWVTDLQDELYDNGNDRLADLIDEIPRASVNLQHARVDALVPEAIHLAREVGSPWLEVFFRHWNMQSLVFMRNEAEKALPEAVALLDFSHRDETRDCPQSVCTVQDLAQCYALADGPGYVKERLAISEETLARIDATWNCFTCISGEKAWALFDDGRYQEAHDFLEEQVEALSRAGHFERRHSLWRERVEVLVRLGRYDDARTLQAKTKRGNADQHDLLWLRLNDSRIRAYQGINAVAAKNLPAFDEILPSATFHLAWAETARLLAQKGTIANDAELDLRFAALTERLSELGANYQAARVALWRAELSALREDPGAAVLCDGVDAHIARLRRPNALRVELRALRERLIRPAAPAQTAP